MKTTTSYRIIKFYFGEEINQVNEKKHITKQEAIDAGNSWKSDCTVNQNITKGRWFEIVETTN